MIVDATGTVHSGPSVPDNAQFIVEYDNIVMGEVLGD